MKTILNWGDLGKYGIVLLTGEACGLSYRFLCDLTSGGKRIVEKCLSVRGVELAECWNSGSPDDPHVGSILLAPEMLVPLGVFALLESGCQEVWLYRNGGLLGIEPTDPPERIEMCRKMSPEGFSRRFAYSGTAGDRNLHVFSGRVM